MSFCLWKELTWERALLRPHYYCYYCSDKICLAKSDSPSANKLDGVCGWVTFSLETAPIFKTILEMSMSREPQHSWSNVQYSSLKISQFAHSFELPVPSLSYIYIYTFMRFDQGVLSEAAQVVMQQRLANSFLPLHILLWLASSIVRHSFFKTICVFGQAYSSWGT